MGIPSEVSEESPVTTAERIRVSWSELLLVLGIATVPHLITSFFIAGGAPQPTRTGIWVTAGVVQALAMEVLSLALLAYVLAQQRYKFTDLGFQFKWTDLPLSLGIFAYSYICIFLLRVVYAASYHWWTGGPLGSQAGRFGFELAYAPLMLVFSLVNPIFEEVLVRAFGIDAISTLTKQKWVAVLAVLLLQVGYHLYQGISNALLISAMMLFFSIYYVKTRRVMPLVLAHAYFDLLATVRIGG